MAVQHIPDMERLKLLLLLLLPLFNRVATALTVKPSHEFVDIVENGWEEFVCQYNPEIDRNGPGEAAVFLLSSCSETAPSEIPANGNLATAAAIWLGKLIGQNPTYREKFGQGVGGPFLNPQHSVSSAAVLRLVEKPGAPDRQIAVSVGPQAAGQCLVCAQSANTYSYSPTRRAEVRLLNRPSVWMSGNGNELASGATHQMRQNDSLTIVCSVTGSGKVTARLLKDELVLRESPDEVTEDIATAQPTSSGLYRCEGISDFEPLRRRGLNWAATNFSLVVKFAPIFDVREIIRYTAVGQRESFELRVRAHPEPRLSCSADPPEAAEENDSPKRLISYDPSSYYAQYRLAYTNLDRVRNLTRINCTATNEIGQNNAEIVLTAKAPRPDITSDGRTSWWNSYHLTWQHHVNANIDSYRIQIVYLRPDGTALNTTESSFAPGVKLGQVAMVSSEDDKAVGHRRHNGVVFNLLPETAHNISLKACNRHGCSDFSAPVSVRTAAQSDNTFNDPNNPKYRETGNAALGYCSIACWGLPMAVAMPAIFRRLG